MARTWGIGPWDNDTALDWLSHLVHGDEPGAVLLEPLETVYNAPYDELHCFDCESAIAAAAVIAAHADGTIDQIPFDARAWILGQTADPSIEMLQLALRSLTKILDESELRFQWEQGSQFGDWYNQVDNIRTRLEVILSMLMTPHAT